MAALQLFAHLEGEALNVALLMPEGERATRGRIESGIKGICPGTSYTQREIDYVYVLKVYYVTTDANIRYTSVERSCILLSRPGIIRRLDSMNKVY